MKKILLAVLLNITTALIFSQVNLDSGLVACYAVNGNAYEPINNLNGTLDNVSATSNRFNSNNKAISFSGSPVSRIELPASSLLKTVAISFSAWIKVQNGSTGYIVYTKNSVGSEAYALNFGNAVSANGICAKKCNTSITTIVNNTTSLVFNTWYHVCFTMDHDYVKVYLNGVLENSVHASMNFNYVAANKIYLGEGFKGSIDNARFYNRVLNAVEVTQLYNSDPACVTSSVPPVASFSISPTVCAGQEVTFTDLSSNNPDAWLWLVPGGLTSNANAINPQFTFSVGGNYTATLICSNSLGSDTVSHSFVVNTNPTVTVSANRTITCPPIGAWLTGAGALTYSWSSSQSGSPVFVDPSPYPSSNATYTVYGADANGCIGTATIQLEIVIDCDFLPENGNGKSIISISPNPTKGKFSVAISNEKIKEYEVVDLLGNLLLKGNMDTSDKNIIDISSYPNGIYFLKIKNEVVFKTIKIVKE